MAIMALGIFVLMFGMSRVFPPGRETSGGRKLMETAVTAVLAVGIATAASAFGAAGQEILIGGAIGFGVFILVGAGKKK
ncbi:MAG: hypothetical protein AAF409_02460 [Pseudomonadota bacterium]